MSAILAAESARAVEAPAALRVRTLEERDRRQWDEFVERCPEATFFHKAAWREVIERAFGHRTHFLLAEANGKVEGILPLAEVRSMLFGHSLVSLPFCVYGGVAAASEQARAALDAEAVALAERLGVGHLEYREQSRRRPDWATTDLYVTFRKTIDPDPEKNLNAIPRKQRAMVRKGIKAGLTASVDAGCERFYRAYADSVHRLGTPVFARRYFEILRAAFERESEIVTIEHEGKLVASVLSFFFRDQVLPYYGGGTLLARAVAGNDFMYWEVMRRACERGLRVFDYGRSKRGSGSFDFKRNWGFEPTPLAYEYRLVKAKAVPEHNPLNPKYRLFIETWKRLPLALANRIGPHIVKSLG